MGTGTGMKTLDNICGETSGGSSPPPRLCPRERRPGGPWQGQWETGSVDQQVGSVVGLSPAQSFPFPCLAPPIPHSPPSFLHQPHPTGGRALWGALRSRLLKTLSGFVSEVCPCPGRETSGLGACSCLRSLAPDGHSLAPLPHLLPQGSEPCPPPPPSSPASISSSSPNAQTRIFSPAASSLSAWPSGSPGTHPCPCSILPGLVASLALPQAFPRAGRRRGEATSGPGSLQVRGERAVAGVNCREDVSGGKKVVFLLQ